MKKLTGIICIFILVLFAGQVFAEDMVFPWAIDFFGGLNTPSKIDFKQGARTGYSLGYGVGRIFAERWMARMSLAFHKFDERNEFQSTYVPLQIGVKYYVPLSDKWSTYFGVRGGAYFGADSISSTDFGVAPYAGFDYIFDSGHHMYVEPRYNMLFPDEGDVQYFGINLGFQPKMQ